MKARRDRCVLGALYVVCVLSGCAEQGTRPTASLNVADSADQVMYGMWTNVSDEGLRRSQITADTAFVYQAAQKMDLRKLRITMFDEQGKQSAVLTAKQGMYTITTGSLDARGNVVVQSTDGRRLTTEHLIYDKSLMQLRSDTSFVYVSTTDRLTGKQFTSDLDFKNVTIQKPRGEQRGAGVLIPGQEKP